MISVGNSTSKPLENQYGIVSNTSDTNRLQAHAASLNNAILETLVLMNMKLVKHYNLDDDRYRHAGVWSGRFLIACYSFKFYFLFLFWKGVF